MTATSQVLKIDFCHQSYHLIKRGEASLKGGFSTHGHGRVAVWADRHRLFVLLVFFFSCWDQLGGSVTDGCIHVLSLALCFSVYGFAFISQIHFSIHLFSLFCMYDSILTLLFLYKQLLKSCHAVSQTQGRTETLISKTLLSFLPTSVFLGRPFMGYIWSQRISSSRVWIWKLDYFMLGFLM